MFIHIETKAGHSAGKPTAKIIEETADKRPFVSHELDVKWGSLCSRVTGWGARRPRMACITSLYELQKLL